MLEANWETIHESDVATLERIRVHGGWIVCVNKKSSTSSCFVPDKQNKWVRKQKNNSRFSCDPSIDIIDKLLMRFDDLVSPRVRNLLRENNIIFVGDIVCNEMMIKEGSFNKIKYLRNFGKSSHEEITNVLLKLGFSQPMPNDDFLSERSKKISQ